MGATIVLYLSLYWLDARTRARGTLVVTRMNATADQPHGHFLWGGMGYASSSAGVKPPSVPETGGK